LLRTGRALSPSELSQSAEGFSCREPVCAMASKAAAALSRMIATGNWPCVAEYSSRPRDERTRRPLEGTLEELLQAIGKPLPLPS
jgi:hypothetical protein